MTFIEFIGFLIAIIAFFFLMAKQAREQKRRREHPEEYEEELEEQEAAIKKLLQSFDIEIEEEPAKKSPPPPPVPEGAGPPEVEIPRERLSDEGAEKDKRHLEAELRRMWKKPKISTKLPELGEGREEVFRKPHKEYRGALVEKREEAYEIRKQEKSRAQKVLGGVSSLKNAVILREILGPPKAFDEHHP